MKPAFFLVSVVCAVASAPATAVTGSAEAGLLAMRKTNLIVLGNWTTGHDVEGKTFVGGSASGNSATLGIGNASQGQDASSRRTLLGGNNSGNRQVIWNFIEATTVTLQRMVNGSVLAPKATLSNNTPIEGSVVAATFNQGGEVHMGTYGADASFLPEPGTWVQLITGFGMVGAFARRRVIA